MTETQHLADILRNISNAVNKATHLISFIQIPQHELDALRADVSIIENKIDKAADLITSRIMSEDLNAKVASPSTKPPLSRLPTGGKGKT